MIDSSFLSELQHTLQKISHNQGISKPGLCLIGTPIGNLADMTLRGLAALNTVDILFCEDTRVTATLLKAYGLSKPLESYHAHNARRVGEKIIQLILSGKTVGLVSDAGLPLISDPGFDLVSLCIQKDIPITLFPGPSASLSALVLSGLSTDQFHFIGFLPLKEKESEECLNTVQSLATTLIFYEAPHRLLKTLERLQKILGNRQAVVARELTKKFEEFQRDTLSNLMEYYRKNSPKGEIVILVEGRGEARSEPHKTGQLLEMALKSLHVKEATNFVSLMTGESRKDLYARALKLQEKKE
ncbi:MAG: 16S rRNA (cytidine(1402)-2'-O)-methyltransferase [Alphaproteobacteria bacterium]|nr:16S rRNA (cytidine(1402)-2'-O)-methyltransferase [Alphaproteobacteria bacterium]